MNTRLANKYSVLLESEVEGEEFASNTVCATIGEILDAVLDCIKYGATAKVRLIDPVPEGQSDD